MGDNHILYFNFFTSDFMNGVRCRTPQEIGVYTMILCRVYPPALSEGAKEYRFV
jgi:hypothetical protein